MRGVRRKGSRHYAHGHCIYFASANVQPKKHFEKIDYEYPPLPIRVTIPVLLLPWEL